MIRTLSLAAVLAAAIALPAAAQTPPAQSPSASPPAVAAPMGVPLKLTADQAKSWIDKAVYSSDDKKVGEVAAFARGADDMVTEMHADIGGFLGLGETRVKLVPAQFKLQGDRAILSVTAEQAKTLPKIAK